MRRPLFHLVIIALVVSAASYASLMPGRASSRASGLINPADGLTYSGAAAENAAVSQTRAVAPSRLQTQSAGLRAPTGSAGLAAPNESNTNQQELLSALLPGSAPSALSLLNCDPSHSDKFCVYEVQAGDTLSGIADRAGLTSTEDVASWELLVHSNKPDIVSEEDLLQLGQNIRIPVKDGVPFNGVIHTVLNDETLSDLSDQYDVPLDEIVAENGIADANSLSIGDEVLIPNPKRFVSRVFIESSDSGSGSSGDGGPQIVGGGPRSDVGFIWPVGGPVSSYFTPRHPLGIDIDLFNSGNAPIGAAKAGTVTFAGGNPCCSYGYYVVIDHGDGYRTLYAHLSSIAVSQGQRISQGQLVGYGGSTGYSTGDHLHFEVHLNGSIVNPLNYLP